MDGFIEAGRAIEALLPFLAWEGITPLPGCMHEASPRNLTTLEHGFKIGLATILSWLMGKDTASTIAKGIFR